jgi:hypothetical protein
MSWWKGTQLKWGTIGERGGRLGREREGGGQFTSNLGPEWTGVAPHAKEGFQVSKRDSGTREVRQAKEELSRGIIRGIRQGVCAMCSHILSILYISCYYVYVANKRIVFRL